VKTRLLTYPCPSLAWAFTGIQHAYTLREVVEAKLAGCWFKPSTSYFANPEADKASKMTVQELQQALIEE
jgi:hypothetical protein